MGRQVRVHTLDLAQPWAQVRGDLLEMVRGLHAGLAAESLTFGAPWIQALASFVPAFCSYDRRDAHTSPSPRRTKVSLAERAGPRCAGGVADVETTSSSVLASNVRAALGSSRFLMFTFTTAAREELEDRLGTDPAFAGRPAPGKLEQ